MKIGRAIHLQILVTENCNFYHCVLFSCIKLKESAYATETAARTIYDRHKDDSSPAGAAGSGCRIAHSEQSVPVAGRVEDLDQSQRDIQCLMKNSILSAKNISRIGTWNVQTLSQTGKLAQLLREFDTYQLDILGVSEMRWTGRGRMSSDGKTVLYSGHEDQHIRGVGFVLNRQAARALVGWKPVTDCIVTARFQSPQVKTTIIQAYAPTGDSSDIDKDAFYGQLQDVFDHIPSHDVKLLIGDFNAKISNNCQGLEHMIGMHGSALHTSDNGERLLLFCNINGLCVSNTCFPHKDIHKKTWRSLNGFSHNEIDYICVNKRWHSTVHNVRSYRGADVGSDHYLVRATLKLKLKRRQEQRSTKPFAVEKLKHDDNSAQYQLELTNRFQALQDTTDIEEQWHLFRKAVTESAGITVGRRRGSHKERWIQDSTWAIIDQRKAAK